MRQFGAVHEISNPFYELMILGCLTVAFCNIATVNMTMAVGKRKAQPSFWIATLFLASITIIRWFLNNSEV